MPNTTSICGYCNATHDAGSACTCPEQRRAMAARTREIEARYPLQRQGIAIQDSGYKRTTGRN